MKSKSVIKAWAFLTGMIAVGASLSPAQGQDPSTMPHILHATIATPPTGPNSNFTVKLTISPADVDVGGFSIVIGYNNALSTYQSAVDNTEQAAGVLYDRGDDAPLTGISYANIFMPLVMSTSSDLFEPVNLGLLNFRTSSTYNPAVDNFYLYMDNWPRNTANAGILSGFMTGPRWIPTSYGKIEPNPTAVSEWQLYE